MKEPVFSHSPERAQTQQEILQRILAQRQKMGRTATPSSEISTVCPPSFSTPVRPSAPLWAQLVGFAIDHPVVVVCLAAGTVIVGPRRFIKWSAVVLPWFLTRRH